MERWFNEEQEKSFTYSCTSGQILTDDYFHNSLTLTNFLRRYVMAIDLNSKNLDFSCSSIDDLIIADIKLQAIVDKIKDYDHPMEWLIEKHEEIKTELKIRLAKRDRDRLKELRKERKEYLTKEEKLKAIDDEIKRLNGKIR